MPGRTQVQPAARRTLTSPISTGEGDQIGRTANRVRTAGSLRVHALLSIERHEGGRAYRLQCGETRYAERDAVLTTANVTCLPCTLFERLAQ